MPHSHRPGDKDCGFGCEDSFWEFVKNQIGGWIVIAVLCTAIATPWILDAAGVCLRPDGCEESRSVSDP